jgi:hypothetical protein
MKEEQLRVLIWGKTTPELSQKYVETVCSAGVREDGMHVRLYPVPLRYLKDDKQYALYDVIEVTGAKSKNDQRPESYRIDGESIRRVSHVDADNKGWARRREWIFKDPKWQFQSIGAFKQAQKEYRRSIGIIKPGVIEDVRVVEKPPSDEKKFQVKLAAVTSQRRMFLEKYKEITYLPFEFKLRWRCAEKCKECTSRPHDMKVLDWGLNELARREGPESGRRRLESIAALNRHDFRLFMGNFKSHPQVFGIVGLWYPKLQAQAAFSF